MERNKMMSTMANGGAIISAIVAFISLFFSYNVATIDTFNRTGFNILNSTSTGNKVLLIVFIILAAAIVAMGILRMLSMLNDSMFSFIFAALGIALLVVSVILFITVTNVTWSGFVYEYKRGAGIIINLIFSILAAIFCALAVVNRSRV